MEWSKFFTVIPIIIACYYVVIYALDKLKNKNTGSKEDIVSLQFEDTMHTKKVGAITTLDEPLDPENGSSGSNNFKQSIEKTRKEDLITTPISITNGKGASDEPVKPTSKIKVISDNVVAGGLSYKDLIQKAKEGSILKSANIDFG